MKGYILGLLKKGPRTEDDIASSLQVSLPEASSTLAVLEIEGKVTQRGGRWYLVEASNQPEQTSTSKRKEVKAEAPKPEKKPNTSEPVQSKEVCRRVYFDAKGRFTKNPAEAVRSVEVKPRPKGPSKAERDKTRAQRIAAGKKKAKEFLERKEQTANEASREAESSENQMRAALRLKGASPKYLDWNQRQDASTLLGRPVKRQLGKKDAAELQARMNEVAGVKLAAAQGKAEKAEAEYQRVLRAFEKGQKRKDRKTFLKEFEGIKRDVKAKLSGGQDPLFGGDINREVAKGRARTITQVLRRDKDTLEDQARRRAALYARAYRDYAAGKL